MKEIRFFGEYSFEKSPMVVMRGLEVFDLPRKQLEILSVLLEAEGEVVSREEIIDAVWRDVVVEEHNLTQTIFLLRRALGRLADGREYIETIPKRGYRIALSALGAPELSTETSKQWNGEGGRGHHDQRRGPALRKRRPFRILLSYLHLLPLILVIAISTWALTTRRFDSQRAYLISTRQVTRSSEAKESDGPILLRNGTLFFSEQRGDLGLISAVSIAGGGTTSSVMAAGGGAVATIHPRKDELLISNARSDGPIATAGLHGEGRQAFGNLSGHAAVWSPDGQWVAYGRDRQLLLADSTGKSRVVVQDLPGAGLWLAWSPDGKTIRFSVQENGAHLSLRELDVRSGKVTPLRSGAPEEHHVCCGSWSSDGRYYVYLKENGSSSSIAVRREGLAGDLFGRRSSPIASGPVDFWRSPVISPDSRHIYAIGEQRRNHLVSLNRGLVPFLDGASIDSISVSHDGAWLAYATYPDGVLWKSRLDGSERTRLSTKPEHVRLPQWSADDRSLLYLRTTDGDTWSLASMGVEGGEEKSMDQDASIATFSYASVDDKVAFDSPVGRPGAPAGISVVSLRSHNAEQLPMSSDLSNVKWSPDGRYLAAVTKNGRELRLFDTQVRRWSTVTSAGEIGGPTWDRTQDILYFVVEDSKKASVRKYTASSRSVAAVAEIPDQVRHGHLSRILEMTPDGDLLIGYSESGSDLYDLTVELP